MDQLKTNNQREKKIQNSPNIWLIVCSVTAIDLVMCAIWYFLMSGVALAFAFESSNEYNFNSILYSSLGIVLAIHTFLALIFWKKKFRKSPNRIRILLIIIFVPLIIVSIIPCTIIFTR